MNLESELLPLLGVALGWFLNEASAISARSAERKRALGQAISVLYFLCVEMVQVKNAQEAFKSTNGDPVLWERSRKRSFEVHTNDDPEFAKAVGEAIDKVAGMYPVHAYELREVVSKYFFIKTRDLAVFLGDVDNYVKVLSTYETRFLFLQQRLERIVRFLARRHSVGSWFRIARHFARMRGHVPPDRAVFIDQVLAKKSRHVDNDTSSGNSAEETSHGQPVVKATDETGEP